MKSEVTSAEESTRRKITPVIHTFTTTPGNTLVLDPGKTLNPVPPPSIYSSRWMVMTADTLLN